MIYGLVGMRVFHLKKKIQLIQQSKNQTQDPMINTQKKAMFMFKTGLQTQFLRG